MANLIHGAKGVVVRTAFWVIRRLEKWRLAAVGQDIHCELQRRALVSTAAFVERRMTNAKALPEPRAVLRYALNQVSRPVDGLVLEFGVFQGGSLAVIHGELGGTVYGFDSFEGLPEDWIEEHPKGTFALPAVPCVPRGVELVVGWFEDTLPKFVAEKRRKVAFLHVDSDLYKSACTILQQLEAYIGTGTIIVFDDFFNYVNWKNGEAKAFAEFVSRTNCEFEFIAYCRCHMQVAVKILGKKQGVAAAAPLAVN